MEKKVFLFMSVIKIKNALLESVTATLASANTSISISGIGGF